MTERIDLDDLSVDSESEESEGNEGDWFWKGESENIATETPAWDVNDSETTDESVNDSETADGASSGAATDADVSETPTEDAATSDETGGDSSMRPRTPHVPYDTKDRPVGIPVEQGGSGGDVAGSPDEVQQHPEASGPHGGGADDMTMVFTYEAMRRLENVQRVLLDANEWCDWLGIVGDVDSHVLNKFQRDNQLDLDFFNGTGTTPAERLSEIDEHSMFFAKRMVLVGVEGQSTISDAAGWEFVPVDHAAREAGWDLDETAT